MPEQGYTEGWTRVSSPVTPPKATLSCMVNGCRHEEETMEALESHYHWHTKAEVVEAAINEAWHSQLLDPLQSKTTNIYVRAFLEWVRHQNSFEEANLVIPAEPTDEEINDLIIGFIETDYRFGN